VFLLWRIGLFFKRLCALPALLLLDKPLSLGGIDQPQGQPHKRAYPSPRQLNLHGEWSLVSACATAESRLRCWESAASGFEGALPLAQDRHTRITQSFTDSSVAYRNRGQLAFKQRFASSRLFTRPGPVSRA